MKNLGTNKNLAEVHTGRYINLLNFHDTSLIIVEIREQILYTTSLIGAFRVKTHL